MSLRSPKPPSPQAAPDQENPAQNVSSYAYVDPVWVDHDWARHEFRGARPTWDIDGKLFAGPLLIPEVIEPTSLAEKKRAKEVLFTLWHYAALVAQGKEEDIKSHYFGLDEKGRHRIA